jgi:hypothetical protein
MTIRTHLSFLLFIVAANLSAQWQYDPNNPQLVSDGSCYQNSVQQVPDGSGGTYLYWLDGRANPCNSYAHYDLYCQHFDQHGNELWESGGREILNYSTTINSYSVRSYSPGETIIGFLTAPEFEQDSLRFQKLGTEGQKLWANDILISKTVGCAPPSYIMWIGAWNYFKDGDTYTVMHVGGTCGGGISIRMSKFTDSGVSLSPVDGNPEGNQYQSGIQSLSQAIGENGNGYLWWTDGNGMGAHAQCMKFDAVGDTLWGPVDVLENTNGINYQFSGASDNSGIMFGFVSSGPLGDQNLYLRKKNSDGSWAWNNNILAVCDAPGSQDRYSWSQDSEYLYMCWADGRPGISCGYSDIYAQKIRKSTGEFMWADDGIPVMQQCTYIPYPRCVLTGEGQLLVVNQGTAFDLAMNAQIVNPDGTLFWPSPISICSSPLANASTDFSILNSGENIIIAWSDTESIGGNDGIYISRIHEWPSPCPADFNNDGFINTTDLLLFVSSFGCSSSCGDYDLTGDDAVNATDLLIFIASFGSPCP